MSIPKKPRKCRVCGADFQPHRCLQQACSFECEVKLAELAAAKSKAKREKAERVADLASRKILKLKVEKNQPLSYWRKRAQAVFNKWIRLVKCAGMSCISCGTYDGQMQAGHYQNAHDHPELAFEPDNVWIQCAQCNEKKSGNIIEYRKALVRIIGLDRVEWLESKQPLPHRRKEDYQRIEAEHKKLLNGLK